MERPLTNKQLDILNAIINFYDTNRTPPTYQEIADIFSISHVTAMQHVKSLKIKGWVDVSLRDSRSIKILKRPNQEALKFNFKPEIVYRPASATSFLTLNFNSLFPPIITDSSVIRTNDTGQVLPPIVSNFLASYEPFITQGCVAECKGIHLPKFFNQISVDHLLVTGYSTHYLNGNCKIGIYLPQEGTKYGGSTVTALNYGSCQLSMDFNLPIQKTLHFNKRFFDSLNNDSTGFVSFDSGQVYQFTKHIACRKGDLEVFILWSLTKFPVLTADIRLKNNILRNKGKVYFYNKRKERICLLE